MSEAITQSKSIAGKKLPTLIDKVTKKKRKIKWQDTVKYQPIFTDIKKKFEKFISEYPDIKMIHFASKAISDEIDREEKKRNEIKLIVDKEPYLIEIQVEHKELDLLKNQ